MTRTCIVGGGILGLALARQLLLDDPGASVVVLEKEAAVAQHQTGRNSGVVHAGLYYAPGSLKARLCRRGVELLQAYCAERGLPYEACGKVLVATHAAELPRLDAIAERATANGVPDVALLDADGLAAVEPFARGIAALHSPHTAITDYGAVASALADDVRRAGGDVRLGVEATRVDADGAVHVTTGGRLPADRVVVCAGLHADRLARASGRPADPRIVPFRGEYWALRPEREHLVRGLVYPVPDPALPFLGVHLTRRVGGGVLVGPNAVLALSREGYGRRDVRARDVRDIAAWPGAWRLFGRHWRTGAAEVRRSASRGAFVAEARRYVPALRARDVVPAPAGVRAQAVDRGGGLVDDFVLDVGPRVAWVRNAPSPAATSALAIAEELVARMAAPGQPPGRRARIS